jgi:4-hydroxy-3-methylbut-2-enyl diphosphate reductase
VTDNRTLLVQTLARGPQVARDRISVLTRFEHPTRGSVRCPAAPAFAATVAERLRSATSASGRDVVLDSDLDASRHVRTTVTAAVSYLDQNGHATGLAAALPAEDAAALDAVLRAICEWTAVMYTRRVLVAEQPACAASTTATAMCPHRRAAHASVIEFTHRGDAVVLVAEPDNALAEQLAADARSAGGRAEVVREATTEALDALDGEAVSFVIVPGTRIEAAARIVRGLRERFPRLRGQDPDTLCYGRSDWYETVRSVVSASDCVLVLSDPAEPTDPTVVEVVDKLGVPCFRVTDPADLRPAQLNHRAIGLIPVGSVTADKRVAETIELLSGAGPLSARRRATRTEALRPSSASQGTAMGTAAGTRPGSSAGQGTRSASSASQHANGWWGSGLLP